MQVCFPFAFHEISAHCKLGLSQTRPITNSAYTNSAYNKLGLHYENISLLLSYKINHVSMRVCVLKEYLGCKNEIHTHTHYFVSISS